MSSTDEQIAALEANREALKGPLRARYHEVAAQIEALNAPVRALQADRDNNFDTLTNAQDRVLCAQIAAARAEAEAGGLVALEDEKKKILRALKDDDGKVRL